MTDQPARYPTGLRRLHWLMAALVLLVYVAIDQRGLFPRGTAGRSGMMQSHFWLGLSIVALALWRFALRRRLAIPPITPALSTGYAWLARSMHWALYAFFVVMPTLGLATLWTGGRSPKLPFGAELPRVMAEDPALHESLEHWHVTIGQAFYWVIGLHIAASLYHHWVRRDDTLRRML
jgi:cytochrome b561